jgi:hypothetical protein
MAKHSSHILEMARKGAEHRYRELKAEIASLLEHFPHLAGSLRGRRRKGGPPAGERASAAAPSTAPTSAVQASVATAETAEPRLRKRRKMSAAARKKISDAQKARWAKQKAKG